MTGSLTTPPVALLTGGGSGLGLHITKALLAGGYRVVAGYATSPLALADLSQQVGPQRLLAVQGDLAEENACEQLVDAAVPWGRIDVVIHNAAITRDDLLVRTSSKDWDAVMDVNLRSAFLLTKHSVRQMMRQRRGRLLYLSSIVARLGNAGQSSYAASKAGLDGLSRSVAQEYARYGITAVTLAAGLVATGLGLRLPAQHQDAKLSRVLHGAIDPEELADIAVQLAGPRFRAVNATTVNVDTGVVF